MMRTLLLVSVILAVGAIFTKMAVLPAIQEKIDLVMARSSRP